MISIIVAASENNAIGKNNKLLWHLPKDLAFFKESTLGKKVIMGRKTFESLGKPLPGRENIVISRGNPQLPEGVQLYHSLKDAILNINGNEEVMIAGGGEIYKLAIEIADRIYLTRVKTTIDDADTFFPEIDLEKWTFVSELRIKADDRHAFDFDVQVFSRIRNHFQ